MYIVWIGSEDKATELLLGLAVGHPEEIFEAAFFGYEWKGRNAVWQVLFSMCRVRGISVLFLRNRFRRCARTLQWRGKIRGIYQE